MGPISITLFNKNEVVFLHLTMESVFKSLCFLTKLLFFIQKWQLSVEKANSNIRPQKFFWSHSNTFLVKLKVVYPWISIWFLQCKQ